MTGFESISWMRQFTLSFHGIRAYPDGVRTGEYRCMRYAIMASPVGPLTIAGDDEGLHLLMFHTGARRMPAGAGWQESEHGVVKETIGQLKEYFLKKRTRFDIPLKLSGTDFQLDVWRELQNIPYGELISYGELAAHIGRPKAVRAVGGANHSNPIPIIIPCHRVIGNNGKMVGYGGGLPVKEALIKLEHNDKAEKMGF